MCGIAGFLASGSRSGVAEPDAVLRSMTDALRHRGPDDSGAWRDLEQGVWLGHRRLSILDLSDAGHQPMISPCGRYVLVFNGEIYNHLEIRRELAAGHDAAWRGHADTETLLAAFSRYGIDTALSRAVGMFAFAVWDREARSLILVRDRLGEKPLYYGWQGETFLFGSELKALRAHPAFDGKVCRDALALLLRHNYVPAPLSIYDGIRKLPPGHLLRVSLQQPDAAPEPYWSALDKCNEALRSPFSGSFEDAEYALTERLNTSIAGQMVADVPVGAFLSGGIDSTLIVALMQRQSPRPVRTFTIGFTDQAFNEAHYAAGAAKALGTDHTELYVTPREAMDVIPQLPKIYDEPFADSSQVPTVLISRLARQQVTVSLSGDGGDELFGGYTRYSLGIQAWRRLAAMPEWMRRIFLLATERIPIRHWNRAYQASSWLLPTGWRQSNAGDKIRKFGEVLKSGTQEAVYLSLLSHWKDPDEIVIGSREPPTVQRSGATGLLDRNFVEKMMYVDLVTYLPDDVLCKVDRAAMSVSLETRVPFLDHRVVEFSWSLPFAFRVKGNVGKRILRSILGRYVPKDVFERPKMGFGIPIQEWLRGPLREWAEGLLDESRLKRQGFLEPAPIRLKWQQHVDGSRDWGYHLWDVLMFQAWLEEQKAAG